MMASELESDVAPQSTTASSGGLPRAVALPEGEAMANVPDDKTVLYRVSTDVEYATRYVKEVDNKLMQFTGKVPEVEQYYALKENMMEAAVASIKARLSERDANLKGPWLLTEIDHWDFEKERMVLLSDNNLLSTWYNFRYGQVEEIKLIPLKYIKEVITGQFVYPSLAVVWSKRDKGVKISFQGSDPGFFERWNPFSVQMPYIMFESHVLAKRKVVTDDKRLQAEDFVSKLGQSLQAVGSEVTPSEGTIQLHTYCNLWGMVYNQSRMGFHKRRGALDKV